MYESFIPTDTFRLGMVNSPAPVWTACCTNVIVVRVIPIIFLKILFLGIKIFCFLDLFHFASAHLKITC